jgi:predicted TPR repeat methyltransferase
MTKKKDPFSMNGQNDVISYFERTDCPSIYSVSECEYHIKMWYMRWMNLDFADKDVLVVGCGDGCLERLILDSCNIKSLTLLDASKTCIESAKGKCPEADIIYHDLKANEPIPTNRKFDIIYSFDVMQYIPAKNIVGIQIKLLDKLKNSGSIYHFGIPEKKRRWITRLDNWFTSGSIKNFFFSKDFVDGCSHWLRKKDFYDKSYKVTYFTPSLRLERFDVRIQKIV